MKTIITILSLFLTTFLFAQNKIYVHEVTADTKFGDNESLIDHPDLNNNPNAQVIVKQHWKSVYNDNPVGITYSTFSSKWVIYNENRANLPVGTFFNVFIGDNSDNFFVHIANTTTQGANANLTQLDHPDLNNNEDSFVFISKNATGSGNIVYNPHSYSTSYSDGKRKLFEASAFRDIPNNAAFNVYIGDAENSFTHITNSENASFNSTFLDHPKLNNNPNATFIFEHDWSLFTSFMNKNLGVFYSLSRKKWAIITQDQSTMPTNAKFNILVALQDIFTAIPDAKFEQALIALGHDTGQPDGKVLKSKISSLTTLDVSEKEIADLTGIQDFVALTELICTDNQLSNLDVSKNIVLEKLNCSKNNLTSLDVISNTLLWRLECSDNQLSSLGLYESVFQNTSLRQVYAHNNNLSSAGILVNVPNLEIIYLMNNDFTNIYLEGNTKLKELIISNNQLTTLDVSKNTALTDLNCSNNTPLKSINLKNTTINDLDFYFANTPNLTCVQVDNVSAATNKWSSLTEKFSTDCYTTLSTDNIVLGDVLQIYPNPVKETLHIQTNNVIIINEIQMYDIAGKMVRKEKGMLHAIHTRDLESGIYFLKIITNKGMHTKKIVIK